MLSILVGNIKGGCGKTTIATHLAAACAAAGYDTALADCDRQASSLGWLARRPEHYPPIRGLDWSRSTSRRVPEEVQRLVIDAPAAIRDKMVEDLIEESDIIVVPVLPGAFDQDASASFLERLNEIKSLRRSKRRVVVVGNRLRTNTVALQRLEEFFGGIGHPVVARIRDTQLYPGVAERGISVFDDWTRRGREHAAEWQPLLDRLKVELAD
jgi:chromosome partitioning protein